MDFLHVHDQGKPEAERVLYVRRSRPRCLTSGWAPGNLKPTGPSRRSATTPSPSLMIASTQKWIKVSLDKDRGNPARGMAKIVGKKVSSIPTLPFTPAQFKAVLRACTTYDLSLATVNKAEVRGKSRRLHALCNLMRWSGLAITDAVTLQRSRLGKDDRLVLYRTKTGNPVTVLLRRRSQTNCAGFRLDRTHTPIISFGREKAKGIKRPAPGRRRCAVYGSWWNLRSICETATANASGPGRICLEIPLPSNF